MAAPISKSSVPKTCAVIDHISAVESFSLETSSTDNTLAMCVVTNGTDQVYLYEDGVRKMILQFESVCMKCYSFKNSKGCYLLFSLTDGSIVCYKVADNNTDQKKKKKKKKSKHKVRDKGQKDFNIPTTSIPTEPIDPSDIFADLLGNDGDQTRTGKESPSEEHPKPASKSTGLASVTRVGEDCAILKEENLQDFLVVNNCLVTCAELEHGWTLSVYQMKITSRLIYVNGDCPDVTTDLPLCEQSPIYRTYFPKLKNFQTSNSIGCLSHIDFHSDQSQENLSSNVKLCIRCIISHTTQIKADSTPSKLIVLEDILYNILFGCESNLLNSPVIVVGLPDGRIYQVLLKSLRNLAEVLEQSSVSKSKSVGVASVGFTGTLLYDLQEPVVGIHALQNAHQHVTSAAECLILLGSQGKVVIITHSQETSKQLDYQEHCVTCPMVASCATRTHVVYSTLRTLFALSVKRIDDSGSVSRSGEREKCAITTKSLGIGKVCALDVLKSTSTEKGDIQIGLMAALSNGQIVQLNVPLTNSHGNQAHPSTAFAAGQSIKELLEVINNISIRMNHLSVIAHNQHMVLEELSKACHLAGQLLGSHFTSHDASVFKTQSQCVFQDEGNQCSVRLECRVTNQSGFMLSHGWSLVLCIDGRTDWTIESDMSEILNQLTRTVQLKDFGPGKTATVIVKLDSTKVSLKLPLQLQCHLHFSLDDFISHLINGHVISDVAASKIELNESGAVLTFDNITVDILMILRPDIKNGSRLHPEVADSLQTTCNTGYQWLFKSLDGISDSRPLTIKKGSNEKAWRNDGPISTLVTVKKEIVETLRKSSGAIEGSNNSEVLVLQWLFRYTPSVLAAITGNHLHTVTPEGRGVTFAAVENDKVAGDENNCAVKLTITAPDYECLCEVHEAVHLRLQSALQRCDPHSITVPSNQLQKQLRHIQDLQRKLETIEDSLVTSQGLGRSRHSLLATGQATLDTYTLLRTSNSTLI